MNEKLLRILALIVPLSLAACLGGSPSDSEDSTTVVPSASSFRSVASVQETRNITYQGVVESSGISIYQEGSHRLALEDGRFLLLESSTIDLESYLSAEVEITGSLRPTVEAGGIIMRVDRIVTLGSDSSQSVSQETSSASSDASSDYSTISSVSSAAISSITPSSSVSSVALSSSLAVTSSVAASSTEPVSTEDEARIVTMASHDTASTNWTQEYCTEHIAFCFPVHRNWWFQSFGATTSTLWHVEVGPAAITSLGDGPLQINLVSGSVVAKKATDGQVRVKGDVVIGYREWTENRHFEIIADARLEAAVRHITANLLPMQVDETTTP